MKNKTLKELRIEHPNIKATSKKVFLEKVYGLGDLVEDITKATGIKKAVEALTDDCGCDERKKKWNKVKLFSKKLIPRCMNPKEKKEYKETRETQKWKQTGFKIDSKTIEYFWSTYQNVFNTRVSKPCINCSPKPIIHMIQQLDILYKESE